jgi:uncharacterized protein (DUF2236 family)
MNPLRQRIVSDFTAIAGAHDDPRLYDGPAGDAGLIGPGSVSWRLHSDVAAVAVAGIPAIVLELLHPSVIAGVQDYSSYREDPFRRARTTLGYVLGTTFGNTTAATGLIERVKRMHGQITGQRPDGVAYRALDPDLIAWVHTAIPWMIMTAYERLNAPLTLAERDRYLAEQAVIGRMGGAQHVPASVADLDDYLASMRPLLSTNEQTLEFFSFLLSAPLFPRALPGPLDRGVHDVLVHAGMSLAPAWARRLSGFHRPAPLQRVVTGPYLQGYARMLRWGFGEPPWARLARLRVLNGVAAGAPLPDVRTLVTT